MMTAVFVNQGKIRKMFGIKKAAKPVSEEKMQGYRTRLRKFYEKHKPEDIDKVDETLEKWAGKEKLLFKKLHEKYVKPKKEADKRRKEEEKNMTPEERMRRDKERKRAKRREERRAERDIDDEERRA